VAETKVPDEDRVSGYHDQPREVKTVVRNGVSGSIVATAGRDVIIRDVIIYEGTKPISAGDLVDACQIHAASVLRYKCDLRLYVSGAVERDLNHVFDSPTGPTLETRKPSFDWLRVTFAHIER
jgi:hypothetical protein